MAIEDVIWILDDGPLGILSAEVDEEDLETWPEGRFFIADATARASGRSSKRALAIGAKSKDTGNMLIKSFDVKVGDPAGTMLYNHLRPNSASPSANLAEHQSIAWAQMVEPRAIIVTMDKQAAFMALSELGRGRVCHAFEFWDWLRKEELLSENQLQALNAKTCAKQGLPGIPWRLQKSGAP